MSSLTNSKIQPTHLQRNAIIYLRQSSPKQVLENRESTARQYALQQRAKDLGWDPSHIDVIDDDLGESGSSKEQRIGFQRLSEDVAYGRVGAIFALEVSRLARSGADWLHLLDLCRITDVVIADETSVFSTTDQNDRLLLAFKGTMSEAELSWIKLRLHGGRLNKARRGDLYFHAASGYIWDQPSGRFRFDPDEQVQAAIRLIFDRFRFDGSAHAVMRYFAEKGLKLPVRNLDGLTWKHARASSILSILRNPVYAGVYAYGRTKTKTIILDGKARNRGRKIPRSEWTISLFDHHPAYISWEDFMENENKLHENINRIKSLSQRGAAREGHALLQGLLICGKCGSRMRVNYQGRENNVYYRCENDSASRTIPGMLYRCWSTSGRPIDQAIEKLFLEAVNPPEIELGLAVVREAERQGADIDRQWKLRLEQASYESKMAERRYKAIDPDNRIVARTLEREWNDKLKDLEELAIEREKVRQREKVELTDDDLTRILSLSKDLSQVWHAETTTNSERKNLLRMLVREITITPISFPQRQTRVQLLWQTGAVSEIVVQRSRWHIAKASPPEAENLIRNLHENGKKIADIVVELNQLGFRTGDGKPWTYSTVKKIRSRFTKLDAVLLNQEKTSTELEPGSEAT